MKALKKPWVKITDTAKLKDNVIAEWKHPEFGIIRGSIVMYEGERPDYKKSEWIYPSDGSADIWLGEFTHYRNIV